MRFVDRTQLTLFLSLFAAMLLLVDVDLDNAAQVFNDSLGVILDETSAGNRLRQLTLGAIAVLSLVLFRASLSRSLVTARFFPIVGFVAYFVLSPLWAVDPAFSARRAVALLCIVVAATALALLLSTDQVAVFTWTTSLAVVGAALMSQLIFGSFSPLDGSWRLAGILHPVNLSWYCGLGTVSSAFLGLNWPRRRRIMSVTGLVFLACLVLTKSRTSLAATILALVLLAFFSRRVSLRTAGLAVVGGTGILLIAVSLSPPHLLDGEALYQQLVRSTSFGRQDAVQQIDTFTGRLPVWEASLELADERPWLGYGHDAFASPEMLDIFASAAGWVPTSPHSGYVGTLLNLGRIGLALLIVVLVSCLRDASRGTLPGLPGFRLAVLTWLVVILFFEYPPLYEPGLTSVLAMWAMLSTDSIRPSKHSA